MPKPRAADSRLQTLTKTYRVFPEGGRAAAGGSIQAVAPYGCELWWDPREVGRPDDFQLLLHRRARSILGALPTTPRGVLMRESGFTPAQVILNSSQQRFAVRIENASSRKPKELHQSPSSSAPICSVVRQE